MFAIIFETTWLEFGILGMEWKFSLLSGGFGEHKAVDFIEKKRGASSTKTR